MTDIEMVKSYKTNPSEANFNRIYKEYKGVLYHYAKQMMYKVNDPAVSVDDIANEYAILLLEAVDRVDIDQTQNGKFVFYVYNHFYLRNRKVYLSLKRRKIDSDEFSDIVANTEPSRYSAEPNFLEGDLQKLLSMLSGQDKKVLKYFLKGLSVKEIAKKMCITGTYIRRIRENIKRQFLKMYPENPYQLTIQKRRIKMKSIFCVLWCLMCLTSCKPGNELRATDFKGTKISHIEFYSEVQVYIVCVYNYEYMLRTQGGIILLLKDGKPARCEE